MKYIFKRKIVDKFREWEESCKIKKRALVIKGLRQVGKTTAVKKFCNEKYENVLYIDFMQMDWAKQLFNGDLTATAIIKRLSSAFQNINFVPEKTVFIFDEIQECSNARTAIKPLMEDGKFDVIATGSLLGLRGYNKKQSRGLPTGFEYHVEMYPMDFEEFLWAKGVRNDVIEEYKAGFFKEEPLDPFVNNILLSYYKEYLCVGGMPDAVVTFLETGNMKAVRDVQLSLLELFKDDFGKHIDENENEYIKAKELAKIMQVYNSIPRQLAKENKKFQYSFVEKNARKREYEFAVNWLEEFGLIRRCYNLGCLEFPPSGNALGDEFKIYVVDSGLLVAMLDAGTAGHILVGDLGIYKGAIYENIVAESLCKAGKGLFYFSKTSGLKIDFVITINDKVVPIEVKSTNGKAKSLREVLTNKARYNVNEAIKLIDGNIGASNGIYSIPLYMASLL